jgi:predicted negative regulator of RcsB-dependent stress response
VQVAHNLETAELPFLAEARAGDVYQLLGDADAAEAYFRRSLAVAKDASEKRQAALRIASLLIDQGREAEASALLAAEHVER